jgi:hypothetical protein
MYNPESRKNKHKKKRPIPFRSALIISLPQHGLYIPTESPSNRSPACAAVTRSSKIFPPSYVSGLRIIHPSTTSTALNSSHLKSRLKTPLITISAHPHTHSIPQRKPPRKLLMQLRRNLITRLALHPPQHPLPRIMLQQRLARLLKLL